MEEYLNKLREFFNNRGLSQAEIARRLGITKGAVNQYFTGKSLFGKKQAERWSQEFGISKTFLLTREGSIVDDMTEKSEKNITTLTDTIHLLTETLQEKERIIAMLKERIKELESK
jgi:transcriptional regulator with XRE-family HTH domain